MSRLPLALFACAAVLSLAACGRPAGGGSEANAGQRAQAIASHYGSSQAFTADLRIVVQPDEGSMLSFSLSTWATPDQRLRISGKKFNVPFIEAMVEADGSFTAVLVRDEAIVRGQLADIARAVSAGEAAGGAAFSELGTITNILRHGPLAHASNWRWHGEPAALLGDLGPELTWLAETRGNTVTNATLRDAEGATLFTLRFTHERDFGRLTRAQGNHLSVEGDASSYLFRLQRMVSVPAISDASLALRVPEGWRELSIEQFLDLLVATE